MRRIDDFLRLSSYLFLGRSYHAYRVAKKIYRTLFRRGIPYRLPDYDKAAVIVEGFAHSGNSFIRTNIPPEFQNDTSSFHRSWAIQRALNNGVPTVLLIRDPWEVAQSWHYRSMADRRGPISPTIVLACWIGYHLSVWPLRERLLVIPFSQIISDYPAVRMAILRFVPVDMNFVPAYEGMNRYTGTRPQVMITPLCALTLRCANWLYRRYLHHAEGQHQTLASAPVRAMPASQQV